MGPQRSHDSGIMSTEKFEESVEVQVELVSIVYDEIVEVARASKKTNPAWQRRQLIPNSLPQILETSSERGNQNRPWK